ncbi:hypothetical protein Tco_0074683, partial [Tanacetum coccineum]
MGSQNCSTSSDGGDYGGFDTESPITRKKKLTPGGLTVIIETIGSHQDNWSKISDDHESRELFLLSNKSIRKIRLHEAYGKQCRSSCRWLLTVGEDFASKLISPLSREIINLPKVDTFPGVIHVRNLVRVGDDNL